jgi:hypothetical protein
MSRAVPIVELQKCLQVPDLVGDALRWRAMRGAIAIAICAVVRVAHADTGWRWGALPVANYDADAGFGLGAIGTLTLHEAGVTPHRASFLLQLFATTERVQGHEARWDVVGAFDPRLRLSGRIALFSTVNNNYCGTGDVTCATSDAEAAADAAGLGPGEARDDFVRHYYHLRFVSPSLRLGARWRFGGALSAFAQWRVAYYRSGTFGTRGPYPGSLYAVDHPDGEPGWASVPQVGVMIDTRDREGTPSAGVWLEASLHGATRVLGSSWQYGGATAIARVYHRLASRVVSATRIAIDVSVGDPPIPELSLVNAADDFVAFGGQNAGRGIRGARYIGDLMALAQTELRVDVSRRWVVLGFVDAAWVDGVVGSGGIGARFVVSQTFILRADVGTSPHEGWAAQAYVYLGHVF